MSVKRVQRRLLSVAVFGALAVAGLGARCIENTSEHVDDEAYTHIFGEFFNDTDVQGTNITLRAMLLDDQGNVLAQKDGPICPPDSQPHSQSVFDLRFDNPNVPGHTRYEVRPIAGKTLDGPLPDPKIIVMGTEAIGFEGIPPIPGLPVSDEDVFFRFRVRNRSNTEYTGIQACAAAYNNYGQVVAAASDEVVQFDEEGNVFEATLPNDFPVDLFLHIGGVPPEAAYVRGWLWIGQPGDPTSAYQSIMTQPITIQTRQFP